MGRASLIMVLGFIFIFGMVRSNLNVAGERLVGGAIDHHNKTTALNIANSLGSIALRMLTENNNWSEWEGDFEEIPMLSGMGSIRITDSLPSLQPGEINIVTRGTVGTTSRIVSIVAEMGTSLPEISGALGLVGPDIDDIFDGDIFQINGNDVNPDGSPGPNPAVPGIAASAELTTESLITELLDEGREGLVRGAGGDIPNVQHVPTDMDLRQVIDALSAKADITFEDIAGEHFVYGTPIRWGTPEDPKIVHMKDDVNAFGSLVGAGILIIDSQLDFNGDFRWEGLVIIANEAMFNHSLDRTGGKGEIFGAVIVEAPPGRPELELGGDLIIQYCSQALGELPSHLNLNYATVKSWEEW